MFLFTSSQLRQKSRESFHIVDKNNEIDFPDIHNTHIIVRLPC